MLDGDSATSVKRAYAVYLRTAAELKRCPARYAADIASEDGGDVKTAVERRVAALRAQKTTHHMTLTDISANGALCAYRIAVVAINSALDGGADTHTTYHGHERADRTGVLILVNRHYRVLLPRDRSAGNTFTRDTIDHALAFARAHALAWHLEATTAPQYPDEPANPPATAAGAAEHKPAKPAEAATAADAPGGAEWKTHTAKMQYAEALNATRAITIDAGPGNIDINAIIRRLSAADVTLSAFARKWTITHDKAVQVEAMSPELHAALLAHAPAVRRVTRMGGLINLTPATATQRSAPAAAGALPKPPPKPPKTRGKPHFPGRSRDGRGRGQPHTAAVAPNRGAGRGEANATAAPGPDPLVALIQQQMQQQQQLLALVLQQRTRSPHRPRTRYCRDCGAPEHDGQCAVKAESEPDTDNGAPARARSRSRGHDSDTDSHGDGSGSAKHRTKCAVCH